METRIAIFTDANDGELSLRVNRLITGVEFLRWWEVVDVKLISTKWEDRIDFTAMVIFRAKKDQ